MTLDDAPSGTPVVIGRPDLAPARCLRMAQVGLRPGAHVVPLHRTVGGGRVLGVGDARVAVGRDVLRKVPVVTPDPSGTPVPALEGSRSC
ncbi:MAG: ferrous iron transport protein A [Kineosporiaceae bacterium]